jgi:alpha-glucosidase
VPVPWERAPPRASWLPAPESWAAASVAAQAEDEQSPLALYRSALALRPGGSFVWRESPAGTLVFERGGLVCAVNVDSESLPLPEGELVLASERAVDDELPRGTAAWIKGVER